MSVTSAPKASAARRTSAREVALTVLRDVFGPEHRRAQESFDVRARRAELDSRDRAFAAELAYGSIKMRRRIDWLLHSYLAQREKPLPPAIAEVLRLGAYQVRFMGGVEPHAAVYETVNLAMRHGHRGTAGLVNAILRRLSTEEAREPQREEFESLDDYLGVRFSFPTWIAARMRERFGEETCEAILSGLNVAPQHAVRVNLARCATIEEAEEALRALGAATTRSPLVAESLICESAVADDPEGRWIVQSEASCVPVDLLDPRSGERIVDMCSGRGHKTAQIVARANDAVVQSIELDERKLEVQRALLERMGAASTALVAGDAAEVPGEGDADAVLLDAPCSGSGILGRHAEARWRKEPGDAARAARMQARLLRAAARRVREGGRLVYSVCSIDACEGSAVVDAFLAENPAFARADVPERYRRFLRDGDVLIAPGIEGRDGFSVTLLQRR